MVRLNETNIIQIALAATLILLNGSAFILHTIKTTDVSRIPVQEIYSQGIALNFYVNNVLPVVVVLAILFIAGLSTFGLYHEATREQLGTRPLFMRLLRCLMPKRTGK